jgi:hypothetical protein
LPLHIFEESLNPIESIHCAIPKHKSFRIKSLRKKGGGGVDADAYVRNRKVLPPNSTARYLYDPAGVNKLKGNTLICTLSQPIRL